VVDSLCHGQKLVVDLTSLGVVLGLSSLDKLKKRLWCNTTVSDKHAVNIESSVEKVLVVAGEDGNVGALASENRDLSVPASHVAHTVLHGNDTGLSSDVKESLEVVGGLGVVGVLEEDQRKLGGLIDDLVAVLRSTRLVAESQPAVRRVEKTSLSTGLLGADSLESGNFCTLASDTSNDGDLVVDRFDKGLDGVDLLLLGKEGSFSGMSEDDKTLDAIDASKPRTKALNGFVVDLAILGEGGDRGGDRPLRSKDMVMIGCCKRPIVLVSKCRRLKMLLEDVQVCCCD